MKVFNSKNDSYSFRGSHTGNTAMDKGGDGARGLSKVTVVCLILFVILVMGGLIAGILFGINREDVGTDEERHGKPEIWIETLSVVGKAVPDPEDYAWTGTKGDYRFAAVASENTHCNRIGLEIMAKHGGSPVDAAIATQFCLGVVDPMFSGIGGGHFMTVYNKTTKMAKAFNAREKSPAATTPDMFTGDGAPSSSEGGAAVAVPGEVLGFYREWQAHGRVPWGDLVQPAIDLARNGFQVGKALADAIKENEAAIQGNNGLRSVFFMNGAPIGSDQTMRNMKLADTLEKIREDPMAMYKSPLAEDIIADLGPQAIMTVEDLMNYDVMMTDALRMPMCEVYTLLTPPPPSSGFIVGLVLRILKEYDLVPDDMSDVNRAVITYQRIIEAFKHAFAQRSKLGDPEFVQNQQLMDSLTSNEAIRDIIMKINQTVNETRNLDFYKAEYADKTDQGTSHVSVFGPDGSAVSVTSTINYIFGSKIYGSRTGIIFNNQMDDFAKMGEVDAWGLAASPSNMLAANKRPMSSMSPGVVINNLDEVALVTGASGAGAMITSVIQTILKAIHFNWPAWKAVDDPRIHHQLTPENIQYEPGFSAPVLLGLKGKGHVVVSKKSNLVDQPPSTVEIIKNTCAVCVEAKDETACRKTCGIEAAVDGRKTMAEPDGY